MRAQPTSSPPELQEASLPERTTGPGPEEASLPERITCRRLGRWRVILEALDVEEDEPFDRVYFDVLMRSAALETDDQGNEWTIERPGWFSQDIRLLCGGHVVAEARRTMMGLGRRYLLSWEGSEVELVGARGTLSWKILAEDRVLGQVRPGLAQPGSFDVELPAGTPDEVLVFVGALAVMVQGSPWMRLLELLTRTSRS